MTVNRKNLTGVFAVITLAGLLALVTTSCTGRNTELQNATLLPQPRALQDFTLTADDGSVFSQASLLDRWTLMFFGFTHCPDICPMTLQQLAAARRALQLESMMPLPDILFVSVDPQRDTIEAVANYVAHFGDGIRGVRGEPGALQSLTSDIGIFFQRDPATGNDYQVSHSTAVLLINTRGELHAILSAPHQAESLIHDLPLLMRIE